MTSLGQQAEPRPITTSVGRDREFVDLRAGLSEVSAGRSHLCLLSGEPGIGKTSLAEEFRLLAVAQGVHLVWGRCWKGGGAPAYWPWIEVLRIRLAETEAEQRAVILGWEATFFVLSQKIRSKAVELIER